MTANFSGIRVSHSIISKRLFPEVPLMYDDMNRLIERHLAPGEQVIWSGRPAQGLMLRPGDAITIPYSILWAGFAFFWETSVILSHAGLFALLGVPFVLTGLYITVGRFFYDAYQRSQTVYAVTDERVMFVQGRDGNNVRSFALLSLGDMSLKEGKERRGTIYFGPEEAAWSGRSRQVLPGVQTTPAFEDIADAKSVYEMIRQAQRAAR